MENFNPKTSNTISDEHNMIASIIGFGFNIVLAILIIHFFLTPQIYLEAPINVTVLGLGVIGIIHFEDISQLISNHYLT